MADENRSEQDQFFALEAAEQVEFDGEGPFMFPLCEAKAGILMGEDVGILILKTVDGDRFGIPLGHEALSTLYQVIGEALRGLKPDSEVMQ
ncbi:hypothetical protein ASF41_07140 [Methylobacterium sp. Leaf111]|jgi:hypothetical protein|uniref:hypothetical protein n=1 Tax=unclassified Methylobacterium TaxID=2615210 RepID=UPI0007006166|nr:MULTISPECIES: hypothetical protein [unclassified Methylobacterium]KQO68005.1 hypothetical protein ASF18_05960 [Methylobacterium sp. Leaf89]KQP67535.1 hypothetical protein ASF41_07140 [Methylobacterium sp. Leaf111]